MLTLLSGTFKLLNSLPDLHEHEKQYGQDYASGGTAIGGITGLIGTLLLGSYIAGKISISKA